MEKVGGIDQLFQLFVPFGHEEELQRKGVLSRVLIEFRQEWVVGELFEDQAGVEMAGEHMRQGCFAGADISFYRDEMMVHTNCFTASGSVHSASNSRIVLFNTGWIRKGAISSSGVRANRRCWISGMRNGQAGFADYRIIKKKNIYINDPGSIFLRSPAPHLLLNVQQGQQPCRCIPVKCRLPGPG